MDFLKFHEETFLEFPSACRGLATMLYIWKLFFRVRAIDWWQRHVIFVYWNIFYVSCSFKIQIWSLAKNAPNQLGRPRAGLTRFSILVLEAANAFLNFKHGVETDNNIWHQIVKADFWKNVSNFIKKRFFIFEKRLCWKSTLALGRPAF